MQPRRVVPTAVMVTAVGVLTAVTIPAFAGSDRSADPSPAPSPSDPPAVDVRVAPELLAALQRDLGLTEEQVDARLEKEAWASQTALALRDALGRRYGGAWLTDSAEQLTVAVTDESAAGQVRAAGAEAKVVRYGEQHLQHLKTILDNNAGRAADSVAGWYIDAASNSVTLLAPAGSEGDARDFAVDSGVRAGGAVRVVASDEQPRLLADVRGGDPYFINDAARCSIGFSVVGGFVTAGHCALAGTTTAGFDGTPQGEFVAASFPGVGRNGPDDWGVVAVNDDWLPQPVVNDFAGGTLPVAGADEAPVGASVCKYGSTTGVSCGVVQALDATVNYPEGTVTGLTRTDVCAEPGDSGGSWLSGDQAQGVTSGGSGNCTVGGTTFFQPVDEILEVNDLTLVTTGSGTGGPQPPATEACDGHEFTFAGNVSESAGAQIQPNGRFYRALSGGTHTVCLAGPEGADLDLALQRWNGGAWEAVAASDGPASGELLTFAGDAGFYRIAVIATAGGGSYTVGLSFEAS